jgi:predicted nucleic acid-binding protein
MGLHRRDKKVERPTKIVVIDASVVVKWFVEEELTNQALTLAEDYETRRVDLRSVQLMPFEVMNALRYNPELGETEVEKAAEALTRLGVALHPILQDLHSLSLRCAYRYGLTIYDASYLALAQFLNCDLYTADKKLIERTKGETAIHDVGDYVSVA